MATFASVDLLFGGALWTAEEIDGMVRIVVGLIVVAIVLVVLFLALGVKAFKSTTKRSRIELDPTVMEPSIARLLKEDSVASSQPPDLPL